MNLKKSLLSMYMADMQRQSALEQRQSILR